MTMDNTLWLACLCTAYLYGVLVALVCVALVEDDTETYIHWFIILVIWPLIPLWMLLVVLVMIPARIIWWAAQYMKN